MDTDKLTKILRCGDASHDEQAQAADGIDCLISDNESLRDALKKMFGLAEGTCLGNEFSDLKRAGDAAKTALETSSTQEL